MTPFEAKRRLIEGNRRFVLSRPAEKDMGESRRAELKEKGQSPFALVVCCSDSRVPPELIFDQGLGDIFVVRTAGNVLDDIGMGSVEYGAGHLGIPLIVVLGHEDCGAVKAAVEGGEAHGCIRAVMEKLAPALKAARGASNVRSACEDENIKLTVGEIRKNGTVAGLIREGKTEVVGAKYGILSGEVAFFN